MTVNPNASTTDVEDLDRYRHDPVAFITECLVDPETNQPFELYPAQVEFLRAALTLTDDGRLPAPELLFGAPKKSGKTAMAAMCMVYVILVLAGRHGEGYVVANDLEQAQGRVFDAICKIIRASPMLRHSAVVTGKKITFSTGARIEAIAADYAGAAGSNAHFVCFDELWGYTTERSTRLWDEMVPPPTRQITARLTTTYAGFEGESTLLEELYKRGKKGRKIGDGLFRAKGLTMAWHHKPVAPWQTEEWLEQMREQLRPNAYIRMIENKFVTNESTFVDMDWWDACVDRDARPVLADRALKVWVGLDGSVKHDQTAIVACTFDTETKRVRLVWHRIFQPSKASPLDFEATVERGMTELRDRFRVQRVLFDPYQLQSVSQRLTKAGLPMEEYPQTSNRLEEMGTNLYELIKHRNLTVYPDKEVRLAVSRSVAVETPRGWKIAKEKTSHKIDVVVAMAMAALGAVESQGHLPTGAIPVLWTPQELKESDARVRMEYARASGVIPEPVKVFGNFAFGGDSSMPDSVAREDDDKPPPGLAPSPFV
jgi:phage terminase large subunit-like protein